MHRFLFYRRASAELLKKSMITTAGSIVPSKMSNKNCDELTPKQPPESPCNPDVHKTSNNKVTSVKNENSSTNVSCNHDLESKEQIKTAVTTKKKVSMVPKEDKNISCSTSSVTITNLSNKDKCSTEGLKTKLLITRSDEEHISNSPKTRLGKPTNTDEEMKTHSKCIIQINKESRETSQGGQTLQVKHLPNTTEDTQSQSLSFGIVNDEEIVNGAENDPTHIHRYGFIHSVLAIFIIILLFFKCVLVRFFSTF